MKQSNVTAREYRVEKSSITFWLPPDLKQKLINRAWDQRISVTGHLLHLIEQDLAAEQPATTPAQPTVSNS